MGSSLVADAIEENRDRLMDLASTLWERPEVSLEEHASAELLADALSAAGFSVDTGIAGLETAFIGRYGEGDPVIGVLGEYDALPGLSQTMSTEPEPVEPGAPGHGCGHNLLGVGSLGAALGVKRAIDRGEVSGTIVYYGTPAEEILVGKPVMIEAGVFDDVDVVLAWHPAWYNSAKKGSCVALDSITFSFTGTAAHAGSSPEAGRSALDALQLMNTGVEFMREHVPDAARIHYSIEEAGAAPNIVDPSATAWYYIRAPDRPTVERIAEWVDDIARGAAMMTQTEVTATYQGGTYDILSNHQVADLIDTNMDKLGEFDIPTESAQFAGELRETLGDISDEIGMLPDEYREPASEQAMLLDPIPQFDEGMVETYSTDVGNVSYVVPVGRCRIATWPVGTPAHSWQAVAASGSIGRYGAVYAAKVLGETISDLMADQSLVDAAVAEFEDATSDTNYSHTVPDPNARVLQPD